MRNKKNCLNIWVVYLVVAFTGREVSTKGLICADDVNSILIFYQLSHSRKWQKIQKKKNRRNNKNVKNVKTNNVISVCNEQIKLQRIFFLHFTAAAHIPEIKVNVRSVRG